MDAAVTVAGFAMMIAFLGGLGFIAYREKHWVIFAAAVLMGFVIILSMISYTTSDPPEPDWSWGA